MLEFENIVEKDVFFAFQVISHVKSGNNFEVVDKVIEFVKSTNVPHQVSAMETTMKGDLDQLMMKLFICLYFYEIDVF